MNDQLVFSHANGFPAPVYRQLMAPLSRSYEVSAVTRFGHVPGQPVAPGWAAMTQELVAHVLARPAGGRVWLVGHSLGGYLSVLAARLLGTRVAGVLLLDSPLITGLGAHAIRIGRCTGLDRHLMPLDQTRRRRAHWPDVAAAHAHFAAKPMFAAWAPAVLRDYAHAGTVPAPDGGRRLLFDPDVEYRIYRTLPTMHVARAAAALQVPVGFVAGRSSREVRLLGLSGTRRVVGKRLAWMPGSHLFPMEDPARTAGVVCAMLADMATGAGATERQVA